MPTVVIRTLDHRVPAVAEAILEVQLSAYVLEARLIGATRFPPLERIVIDILHSNEVFVGAEVDGELAGVLSHEAGPEAGCRDITSLAVAPRWHRSGIATKLLAEVLGESAERVIEVSTATANAPALGLYARFGFVEESRCVKGPEPVEIVHLRLVRE
ncbi:MAG TPA: GNAT family N-acetyltransferase [Coriobacteriia bacterium]